MFRFRSRVSAAVFFASFLVLGTSSVALAQTVNVVIPASTAGVEQSVADNAPLSTPIQRMQQVYDVSLLDGLIPGDQITGITFRLDSSQTGLPAQSVTNYEIRLSRSVNEAGSLSLTFADNRGPDDVIVRSGPLTFSEGDFTGGASPNAFGAIIPFTTPYIYKGGPLLLELANDGFVDGRLVDDNFMTGGQEIFGLNFDATTANYGTEVGAIPVQFRVERRPEIIPTLSEMGFIALILALITSAFIALRYTPARSSYE